MVLVGCGPFAWPTKAASELADICRPLVSVQRIYRTSDTAITAYDQRRVIDGLTSLTSALNARPAGIDMSQLDRARRNLSSLVGKYDGRTRATGFGIRLYEDLFRVREDLKLVAEAFGCQTVGGTTPSIRGMVPDPATLQPPAPAHREVRFALPGPRHPAILLAVLLLLSAITVELVRLWRRNDAGTDVCRTPALVHFGPQCCVTNIVEINGNSMKVEATDWPNPRKWVDVYFCGHRATGRIVRRNKYYETIEIRGCLSPEALKDAKQGSRKSIRDSGLDTYATPCFHPGCHLDCPLHQPTAISKLHDKTVEAAMCGRTQARAGKPG